jgi:diacylglycerol O-acyltransferase / wax synthase
MEQLSGLDAAFLALDTPRTTGHVGSIQVVSAASRSSRPLRSAALR